MEHGNQNTKKSDTSRTAKRKPDWSFSNQGISIVILALICIVACTCAYARATLVPLFQESDELAHIDYAMTIYNASGLYKTASKNHSTHATSQATYLMKAYEYGHLRYNHDARLPSDYNTQAFRDKINERAPRRTNQPPSYSEKVPYVAYTYPSPYYLGLATVAMVADRFRGPKLADDAYIMRYVGLPFLVLEIVSIYGMFVGWGASRTIAYLAAFATGMFPTVQTLFSSVQPDLVTTACVSAAVAATCYRIRRPKDIKWSAVFIVACAALTLTKIHYGLITWVTLEVTTLIWGTRSRARTIAHIIASLSVEIATIYIDCATRLTTSNMVPEGLKDPHGHSSLLEQIWSSMSSVYLGGPAFQSYWYGNGIYLSHVFIPAGTTDVVKYGVILATIITGLRYIAWIRHKTSDCVKGGWSQIHPAAIIYAVWSAFIVAVDVQLDNTLGILGRYYAPMVGPMLAIAIIVPSGSDKRRDQDQISVAISAVFCVAALALCAMDLRDDVHKYKIPPDLTMAHVNEFFIVNDVRVNGQKQPRSLSIEIVQGEKLQIGGYAIDDRTGRAGDSAYAEIDGVDHQIGYPLKTKPYVAGRLADDDLPKVSFRAEVKTDHMTVGIHQIGLVLKTSGQKGESRWAGTFTVNVRERGESDSR